MTPNLLDPTRLTALPRTGPSFPRPVPPVTAYPGSVPRPSNGGFNFGGAYNDRQWRHDVRERRRDGDWGVLEFPMSFLWLGDQCVPGPFGELECAAVPAVVDLWP
jgi:hypothetical protein